MAKVQITLRIHGHLLPSEARAERPKSPTNARVLLGSWDPFHVGSKEPTLKGTHEKTT